MTIDMKSIHDSDRTLVMGVLNITEDSFSDGGLWLDPAKAKAHGEAMMKDGADIIDIGAESTRPGAKRVSEEDEQTRVSEEDEQTRVLGAVDALIPEGAVLSIDPTRASVARMALEHGAPIINDVVGWTAKCPMWWPNTRKAFTLCSIGAVGLPALQATCLTLIHPCTPMAWWMTCMTNS